MLDVVPTSRIDRVKSLPRLASVYRVGGEAAR